MTKRPEAGTGTTLTWLAGLVLALAGAVAVAQQDPSTALYPVKPELENDWYRTEILIFARTDENTLQSEQWAPLPELAYPERYRYLIDAELAERRLVETGANYSRIDDQGYQTLVMNAAITPFDDIARPDALLVPLEAPLPTDPNLPDPIQPAPDTVTEVDGPSVETLPPQLLVQPYELLDPSQHEFVEQARILRRRGQRILFHGSWWSRLADEEDTSAVVVDRSADPDESAWPALQGSVRLYRSRYLHVNLNLWLNTMGDYLPEGWQIDPPALPRASVRAETRAGDTTDPWNTLPLVDPATLFLPTTPIEDEPGLDVLAPIAAALPVNDGSPAAETGEEYPWRHAIVHRQSRRMRSGEIHYLDHPVIGVVIRVVPAGDEYQPLVPASEEAATLEHRERHALPSVYVEASPDSAP